MTVQTVSSSPISSKSSSAWRFWNKGKAAAASTSLKASSSSNSSKKAKKDKKQKKKKKNKSSREDANNQQHRFDSMSTTVPSEVRTSSLNHSRDGSVSSTSSTNSMTEMMQSHSYDASESFRLASASNIGSIDVPRQVAEGITLDQQEALKDETAQQVERIDLDASMQALMEAEEHHSASFQSSRVDLDTSVQVILDLQKQNESEDDQSVVEAVETAATDYGAVEESVVAVGAKELETVLVKEDEEEDVEDEDSMKEVFEKTVLIENALPETDDDPTTPVNQNGAATIINPQDETQRVLRYFFAAVTTSLFLGLFVGRGKGKETTK